MGKGQVKQEGAQVQQEDVQIQKKGSHPQKNCSKSMQSAQVQKKWNEVLKKSVFRFDSSTETISGHATDIWSGKGATAIPAMVRCFGIVLVLTPARGVLQILMSNMLMRC